MAHRQGNLIRIMGLAIALLAASRSSLADQPLTAKDVARLKIVTTAEISPDGQQVAYILSVPRRPMEDEDGLAWNHLRIVDRSGRDRSFISGEVSIGAPQWSADGRSIFYTSKRTGDKQTCLYRIPTDGGESERVLAHSTSIGGYAISSNGSRIAFLASAEDSEADKKRKDKGFNQEIYEEDGKPTLVWLADLKDGKATEATSLELAGSASEVRWHPSGQQLAIVLAPTPNVDDSYMAKRIHIYDLATKQSRVVEHVGKLGDVQWSRDGNQLAFIGSADVNDPHEGRLMVVPASLDSAPRDLLPDLAGHISSIAWGSDDAITWTADIGTRTRVGRVSLTGQVTTLVDAAPGPIFSGLTLADDGLTCALIGHAKEHPPEVFLLSNSSSTAQRLSSSNDWLNQIRFARQETITWEARDGVKLEGILVYPLEYEANRRYPMIMLVHGGPESHEPDGWMTSYSRPGHLAAAKGFFVFYPNYRGSTGRGVAFSKLGQADAAGREFDDLIDGIDHLFEQGLVDRTKVGITGGSYGGYASAWGATYYSDRFAASVMFVGISDNVSKIGTTDIPEEMYLVHHRKRLWEDWNYFLERSPIRHVEKNRTPTLILHGKEDPRVHPSQSLELHRHLKTLGQAPVRLVLYAGEGHGNRKAASRLDYNLRMMQWMEHYLLGPGGAMPPLEIDYAEALQNAEPSP